MNTLQEKNAIMDTGPWVALIDRSESRHEEFVAWFKKFIGRLYTTEAVLTEVMYLLNFSISAQLAAMDFILQSAIETIPSDVESIKKCKSLMKKYADLPMDYADATILCLAEDTGIRNIVTFDSDFLIYRTHKNQPLKIIPCSS